MKALNVAECVGNVGEQADGYWILKAERKITAADGTSQTFTDDVLVHGEKPAFKRAYVAGRLTQFVMGEDENGKPIVRTYLDPKEMRKASKDEYKNVAALIGEFFRWIPNRADESKVPFGIQLLRIGKNTLRAILFDNPRFPLMRRFETELKIKDAAREGTIVSFEGRLRTNSYNNGNSTMLELVADKAGVELAAENPFAALNDKWDAEEGSGVDAAPDTTADLDAEPAII